MPAPIRFASLAFGVATLLMTPLLAQQPTGPNINIRASGQPGGASALAMAQDLYAAGVASGDALTVLTAARLALSVTVRPGGDLRKEVKGDAAGQSSPAPASETPADGAAMLARAAELAGEDEQLAGMIEDAGISAARTPGLGAVRWTSVLAPGQTEVWEVPFFGNSAAEVAVLGDGASNLDVLVTDENGNTICYDVGWSDRMACDFVPSWNGFFSVTVQNAGTAANSYVLLTN